MIRTGTHTDTPARRAHTHGEGAGLYVMKLVLLKVYMDHVAPRNPLKAAAIRHTLTPSLVSASLKTFGNICAG